MAARRAPGRALRESGAGEAVLQHRELVVVGASAADGDGGARSERPRARIARHRGPHRRREEPLGDRGELADHLLLGPAVDESAVVVERGREHAERVGVALLVVADAGEDLALVVVRRQLDQPAVGERGRHLQHHVELAVPAERLEAQLALHHLRDAARHPGHGHQHTRRPRAQRRMLRITMVLGRRHPARQRALELTAVHHHRRRDPAALQEDAAQELGVELLVLPDPHQGLAHHGSQVVADREVVDASGDRLLAVRDRDDLLPFEREQPQVFGLRVGTARVLAPPAREQTFDLREHDHFELTHGGPLTAAGRTG